MSQAPGVPDPAPGSLTIQESILLWTDELQRIHNLTQCLFVITEGTKQQQCDAKRSYPLEYQQAYQLSMQLCTPNHYRVPEMGAF